MKFEVDIYPPEFLRMLDDYVIEDEARDRVLIPDELTLKDFDDEEIVEHLVGQKQILFYMNSEQLTVLYDILEKAGCYDVGTVNNVADIIADEYRRTTF